MKKNYLQLAKNKYYEFRCSRAKKDPSKPEQKFTLDSIIPQKQSKGKKEMLEKSTSKHARQKTVPKQKKQYHQKDEKSQTSKRSTTFRVNEV